MSSDMIDDCRSAQGFEGLCVCLRISGGFCVNKRICGEDIGGLITSNGVLGTDHLSHQQTPSVLYYDGRALFEGDSDETRHQVLKIPLD